MLKFKVSYVYYDDDYGQGEKLDTLAAFKREGDACLYAQGIHNIVKHHDIYYKLIVHSKKKTILTFNLKRS